MATIIRAMREFGIKFENELREVMRFSLLRSYFCPTVQFLHIKLRITCTGHEPSPNEFLMYVLFLGGLSASFAPGESVARSADHSSGRLAPNANPMGGQWRPNLLRESARISISQFSEIVSVLRLIVLVIKPLPHFA